MAPIRRYLRISRYSVLEVRIHLEDPYQQAWLVDPRGDVLPRIFSTIKPFVFRQLREEKERQRGKSKKKKGVKDVAIQGDFEVSVYLMDTTTRHSLLLKQKQFRDREKKVKSNSGKMTGWLRGAAEKPIELEDDSTRVRMESDDEDVNALDHYPEARRDDGKTGASKENTIFVQDEDFSEDEGFQPTQPTGVNTDSEDKKKLSLNLAYDGFELYGKILCLIVKRRGAKTRHTTATVDSGGKDMMENWVSTQAEQDPVPMDD